jgi:hypothetical protein
MATGGINLKPLLLGDAPAAAISTCADAAGATARRGLGAAPALDLAGLATDLGEKIDEMFDLPLLGLMVGAWRDLRELADSADPDKHPPGESTTVSLFDHDLEASFAPHLDIAVSGLPALRVDFEIVAAIELHGIELRIQGGAIRAVRLGSCQAAAKVKCAGAVIFERSSRKLAAPGEIVLSQAIPIGPPSAARA